MDARVMMSGNLGGVAYTYAKYLRKRKIDVSLYLWNWELRKNTRNPLKTDVDCKALPDWVRSFSDTRFLFGEFRKKAKDFDIHHAFNTDPIYAQFTGKPFISHPVGSDAREFALARGIHPLLLRRAYQKNETYFYCQLDYQNNVLTKCKIKNPIYIEAIQENLDFNGTCEVPERTEVDELFFHPSSHIDKVKGNQILINAYAKYLKKYNPNAILVMIEWGEDVELSKKLVRDYGISDRVIFKKWLSKQDVYNYMLSADIVFDQFILPSSSLVQREACALGKPVVKYMDGNWFKVYSEMPFVPAGTADELYNVFTDYHKDPEKYIVLGRSAKAFSEKYYDWKYITDKIIAEYERMAPKRRGAR